MNAVIRRFWSVVLGGRAARISLYDEHGGEHYAILSDEGLGAQKRERRERAVEALRQHVFEERDPGQVGVEEKVEA